MQGDNAKPTCPESLGGMTLVRTGVQHTLFVNGDYGARNAQF